MNNPNQQPSIDQQPFQETQQPIVPPSNPLSTPHKSKTPLFILIAFVVLILIGGGGYFLNSNLKTSSFVKTSADKQNLTPTQKSPTPTTDPTANWKTYTNTRFNYSFKYPSGLTVSESLDPNGNIYQTSISNTDSKDFASGKKKVTDADVFEIWIVNNPPLGATTLEVARKPYKNSLNYSVDGQQAFKFIGSGLIGVVTVYNNHEYDFNLGSVNSKDIQYFDQILSTFKFTN